MIEPNFAHSRMTTKTGHLPVADIHPYILICVKYAKVGSGHDLPLAPSPVGQKITAWAAGTRRTLP
jgi:hypothetical protein